MGCVIGAVDKPAPGPFDVFDTRIVGLDLARRSTGNNENLDLLPPLANGPPEPRRFGLAEFLHQLRKLVPGRGGIGQ